MRLSPQGLTFCNSLPNKYYLELRLFLRHCQGGIRSLSGSAQSPSWFSFAFFSNAKNVLSFARQDWAHKTHANAFDLHVKAALKSQTLAFTLPELFKTLSILIAVLALFYSLSRGESLTLLIATLAVFIRMLPKLANFTEAYARIKESLPSIDQYDKLFPKLKNNNESLNKKKINNFISSINLKDVSFSYQTRKNVLININIDIKKNSFVSFVGSSGSGKTTCSDLITLPTRVMILVNSMVIKMCLILLKLAEYL